MTQLIQKGFVPTLILVGFLAIAGLAGVSYYFGVAKNPKPQPQNSMVTSTAPSSSTSDETANWKTYTNELNKISFKYPSSDNIYKCGGESTSKPNEIGGSADGTEKECVSIIEYNNKSTDPTFSMRLDFLKESFETLVANNKKNNSKGILITISSKPAYTVIHEVSSKDSYKNKQVYIKQSPTETISFVGSYDNPASITLFDTILSTVKFTDQNQEANTTDWKTYTNTEYKYAIKYPLDWAVSAGAGIDQAISPFLLLKSPCNYESGQTCSQLTIQIGQDNGKLEPSFNIDPDHDKVLSKKLSQLDGKQASEIIILAGNQYLGIDKLYDVLVANNNNIKYNISYEESAKDHQYKIPSDWQNKKLVDQILSTFKFTN